MYNRKQIELVGDNLDQFSKENCPLNSTVHLLTTDETMLIRYLRGQWLENQYPTYWANEEEAKALVEKMKTHIHYETI